MQTFTRLALFVIACCVMLLPLVGADTPRPGPKPPKPWPPVQNATYQCLLEGGCDAETTEDGEIVTVHFRKGDLASTEGGYRFDVDDGWECIDP